MAHLTNASYFLLHFVPNKRSFGFVLKAHTMFSGKLNLTVAATAAATREFILFDLETGNPLATSAVVVAVGVVLTVAIVRFLYICFV